MANLQVTDSYAVNSKILALRIETGVINPGTQSVYQKRDGDFTSDGILYRDGKAVGQLVNKGKTLRTYDSISGPDLDEDWAKNRENYRVNGVKPVNVFIKSKVSDSALTEGYNFEFAKEHTVFLELPEEMQPGQQYALDFRGEELTNKRGRNYNGTDVYIADFSDFKRRGKFKVVVDRVGTSFPFEIGDRTWQNAFQTSTEGLYTQRSGIELKPEFSDYTAPRSFHPDDGIRVEQTNAKFTIDGDEAFDAIRNKRTGEIVENAWDKNPYAAVEWGAFADQSDMIRAHYISGIANTQKAPSSPLSLCPVPTPTTLAIPPASAPASQTTYTFKTR